MKYSNSSTAVQRTVLRMSWIWLIAAVVVGLSWLIPSNRKEMSSASTTEIAFHRAPSDLPEGVAVRNIEDIRVGDRVLAYHPQISDFERLTWSDPDPSDLRRLHLKMPKSDGGVLEIDMLRPTEWLAENSVLAGGKFFLDLPEMGAQGEAQVISVEPCPRFQPGDGRIVTATFAHPPSTDVLEVHFEGEKQPIGVTDNHLFWCEERADFVPIGEIAVGESVLTYAGIPRRLESKVSLPRPERVYNLEVYGEHVYFVGDLGLLAHNEYLKDLFKKAGVNNFDDFWNKTSYQNLKKILADPHSKDVLEGAARRLRRGGGDHEWYMVSNLLKMKEWKVSADQLRQMQQSIKELNKGFKSLASGGSGFRHGGSMGSAFHKQLDAMIQSSSSLRDFAIKLRAFANKELKNGISDLPSVFHNLNNFK